MFAGSSVLIDGLVLNEMVLSILSVSSERAFLRVNRRSFNP